MSGGIDVCKNSLKTNIKTVVLFLPSAKVDQNICSSAKNLPVLAGLFVDFPFTVENVPAHELSYYVRQ